MIQGKQEYKRDYRSPKAKSLAISELMSKIKSKNTGPEIFVRKFLWHSGYKNYRLHAQNIPGKPDILFSKKKIALFVNGCFWHRCPYCKLRLPNHNKQFWADKFERNVARDKLKNKQLKQLGYKVITVWECQLKRNKLSQTLNRIIKILDSANCPN